MDRNLNKAAVCYGLYKENKIIGFLGVLHQPHPINKKIKRVTRLVILPDYQGIGLGKMFLNAIAEIYKNEGFDFSIKTSAKNLIFALKKDENWVLKSFDYSKDKCRDYNGIKKTYRKNCKAASFMYKKGR